MSHASEIERLTIITLARWASEPCECAARAARTEFPLKPEHVECQSCRARKALTRRERGDAGEPK